jgi:hypothetical protein
MPFIKISFTHETVMTMRARDMRHILVIEERIKLTASATITTDNKMDEPSFSGDFDLYLHGMPNFFWEVLPRCWFAH